MCTNYAPVQAQLLRDVFGVEPPASVWKPETWRDYPAPIVRADQAGNRVCVLAGFGMVPRAEIKRRNAEQEERTGAPPKLKDYDTMNARAETAGTKSSFSGPLKKGQFCLVPMTTFAEPSYEHGPKPVWYNIWMREEPAFAVAGLWRDWPSGASTFTMLTVNAEHHALLRRFHKPGKEKRGVVVLPPATWDDWLACRDPEVARSFLTLPPAELMAAAPTPKPT